MSDNRYSRERKLQTSTMIAIGIVVGLALLWFWAISADAATPYQPLDEPVWQGDGRSTCFTFEDVNKNPVELRFMFLAPQNQGMIYVCESPGEGEDHYYSLCLPVSYECPTPPLF